MKKVSLGRLSSTYRSGVTRQGISGPGRSQRDEAVNCIKTVA